MALAQMDLRFSDPVAERSFKAYLQPRVAARTVSFHCAAFALRTMAIAWGCFREVNGDWKPSAQDEAGISVGSLAISLGVVLSQALICAALLVMWRCFAVPWLIWEVVSISTTAFVCAASLWSSAWHSSVLLGMDSDSKRFHDGYDCATVFVTVMTATGFCALVPVRSAMWPVIPLCSLFSYVIMVASSGSPDPGTIPYTVGALLLLFVWPAGNLRRLEQLEREGWQAAQDTVQRISGMGQISSTSSDITFTLSDGFLLKRTNGAVHDPFFGRRAEGLIFTSMLPCLDRIRFQQMIDVVCESKRRESALVTLNLPRGPVRVLLSAEQQARDAEAARGGDFLIGLSVVEEGAPVEFGDSSSVSHGCSSKRDSSAGRVGSVPEDLPLPDMPVPGSIHEIAPERAGPAEWAPTAVMGRASHSYPAFMNVCPSGSSIFHISDGGSEWCMETDAFTGRRPTHTIASQTTRVALVDAAVNTSIVMEEFSFRCIACSKPPPGPRYYSPDRCAPVLPGKAAMSIISKLDQKKGVCRQRSPERARESRGNPRVYQGTEFNGFWQVVLPIDPPPNAWLQRLCIYQGRVLLGDDSEAQLLQATEEGTVYLCGGELHLLADGHLERIGQSGASVIFALVEMEDTDAQDDDQDRITFGMEGRGRGSGTCSRAS